MRTSIDAVPIPASNETSNSAAQPAAKPLQHSEGAPVKSEPPQRVLMRSPSCHCILAVQNARGFLIPICAGRDLLFELKKIWRT